MSVRRFLLRFDREFGGEKTLRAKVIRELIDEIRQLRSDLARAQPPPGSESAGGAEVT